MEHLTKRFLKVCACTITLMTVLAVSAWGEPSVSVSNLAVTNGADYADGQTLRYFPSVGAPINLTLDVDGTGFKETTMVHLNWLGNPAVVSSADAQTITRDDGSFLFEREGITLTQNSAFENALNQKGEVEVDIIAAIKGKGITDSDDIEVKGKYPVTFVPRATEFSLSTEETIMIPSSKIVTVNAHLRGTLPSEITWTVSVDGNCTAKPRSNVTPVEFGYNADKKMDFDLANTKKGDRLTIRATLRDSVNESGDIVAREETLTVYFLDKGLLTIDPSVVQGYQGFMLDTEVYISESATTSYGVISIDSIDPPSWNGIDITWEGNAIYLVGIPESNGNRDITVKSKYNDDNIQTTKFSIVVSDPVLDVSEPIASAKVGESFNKTVTFKALPEDAVLTDVELNAPLYEKFGLAASLDKAASPVKLTVSGTPTEKGTALFTVTGFINDLEVASHFSVLIDSNDAIRVTMVGKNASDWEGVLNPDNTFELKTAFRLPRGVRLEDCEAVIPVFPVGVVYDYVAVLIDENAENEDIDFEDGDDEEKKDDLFKKPNIRLHIEGELEEEKTAADLILLSLSLVLKDKTVYAQPGIKLSLQEIQNASSGGGGGGGCNGAVGTTAFALLALWITIKRR